VAPGSPGSVPETAAEPPANGSQPPNVMQTLRPLLGNPTNLAAQPTAVGQAFGGPQQGNSSGNSLGRMNGGGALAGVASKAKGHTIKLIDDQSDYSLWEFHYDPTKDTGLSGGGGQGTASPGAQTGSPGNNSGFGNNPGFGSNQTGFGSQNTNQSGFGQATPSQPAPTATPTNPNSTPQ
jgi:hypothetical protein